MGITYLNVVQLFQNCCKHVGTFCEQKRWMIAQNWLRQENWKNRWSKNGKAGRGEYKNMG